jgi:hypothetical protein
VCSSGVLLLLLLLWPLTRAADARCGAAEELVAELAQQGLALGGGAGGAQLLQARDLGVPALGHGAGRIVQLSSIEVGEHVGPAHLDGGV